MTEAFVSARPSLHLDGERDANLQDALTNLVVNLPLNGMGHAELTLNNWGLGQDRQDPDQVFQELGLGRQVEIYMTPDDEPVRIFAGEVTAIEERYGQGAPQLSLLLQDGLHRLARTRNSRVFEDVSPDDVVQIIAGEFGLTADVNVSAMSATYHQVNESDLAFLFRLLGRFDIGVRLLDERLRARPEEQDPEPLHLDAQDNALRVRLLADLNHQPLSVQVLGFNTGTDEAADGSADALSQAAGGTTAAATLGELGWPGEEVIAQPFARSQAEADGFARGHFDRHAKRFISGDIRCGGEPRLRSGREIELAGVSERLRGTYQVVHAVHRFDGLAGYQTHIKVQRPDWQV